MFHPVGSQPPSVYWRRRLVFLASLLVVVVLLLLTVNALRSTSAAKQSAAPHSTSPGPSTPSSSTSTSVTTKGAPRSSTSAKSSHTSSTTSGGKAGSTKTGQRSSSTSSAPAAPCVSKNLAVQAVAAKPSYHVGDKPVLQLQVTNTGTAPCVQNLADSQVELRVYNGESRVWGSHDCKIQPGVALRTLAPGTAVQVVVNWSGLSSEPKCAGTRQRVGAGTYTLYALLAGHAGKAAQFSIS